MKWLMSIPVLSLTLLASCGSDNSAGGSGSSSITSTFVDGKVAGLEYRSTTKNGKTDSSAQFICTENEVIEFLVNSRLIGSAKCKALMTPYDIQTHDSLSDSQVNNIAYLLTNLDADNDPTNGISIDDTKKSRISSDIDLADDSAMDTLANTVRGATALISRSDATNHLKAFAKNAKTYNLNTTISVNVDNDCEELPVVADFDGAAFTMKLNGKALKTNHVRGTPTMTTTSTGLSLGGSVTGSANPRATATINSGKPAYFQDTADTGSSLCTNGATYAQTSMRISDATLTNGVFAGKWAYTITCVNGSTYTDYDECHGTFTSGN